jgi:hypothetical protein
MMAATVQLADWEGFLATAAALCVLLAFCSWLLSPSRRFPRLRLERPARRVDTYTVLVLGPPLEDVNHHGPRPGVVIHGGFDPSERNRAIPHERLFR